MCRLENLLIAIELKSRFSHSFPEGSEVTAQRVLEALTTEKCMERFSLERLEVLGDAFLKYAVGRHVFLLHETVDEGQLTRKRSSIVNNNHLYKLAIRSNLQVYIRDEHFDPSQFFALGRPCRVICDENTKMSIHFQQRNIENEVDSSNVRCSKGHHWLHKKTVADVVEALVGAFIVDSGFKAATAFLKWIGIQLDFEAAQISELCMASKSYLSLSSNIDTSALEESLGYSFLHKGLLIQAFVHPSYNKHIGGCYQRLEFLGDAVLDYLITSYLFSVYPELKPGQLTDLRSVTVNNNVFAHVAVFRSFHKHLISDSDSLSEAVQKFVSSLLSSPRAQNVEGPRCPKALGDLVESTIGAILLDTGFNLEPVWKIMLSFLDSIMSFSSLQLNPVRELAELCQSRNWKLDISSTNKGGRFLVNACVRGGSVHSTGQGINLSKKAATRTAAREISLKLKEQGYGPKKSKSMQSLLKSNKKQEAKLIGYNETPIPAALLEEIQLENLKIQEPTTTPSFSRQPTETPQEQYHEIAQTVASVDNSRNGGTKAVGSANTTTTPPPFNRQPIPTKTPREQHCGITQAATSVDRSQIGVTKAVGSANTTTTPPFNRQPIPTMETPKEQNREITQAASSVGSLQSGGSKAVESTKTTTTAPPFSRQPVPTMEIPRELCSEITQTAASDENSQHRGSKAIGSAKSRLFETCQANCWRSPVFEIVNEEGPSHLKLFTAKVTVEIPGNRKKMYGCLSNPQPRKKAAEEEAAEGALWILEHHGYLNKNS